MVPGNLNIFLTSRYKVFHYTLLIKIMISSQLHSISLVLEKLLHLYNNIRKYHEYVQLIEELIPRKGAQLMVAVEWIIFFVDEIRLFLDALVELFGCALDSPSDIEYDVLLILFQLHQSGN